jgi:Glycosyltransferases involved in cell wall biogenesis
MMKNKSKMLRVVSESPFFNEEWYLKTYPDVVIAKIDAAEHYLHIGWILERNPGPNFSTRSYLQNFPELRERNICPLVDIVEKKVSSSYDQGRENCLAVPTPQQIEEIKVVRASRLFDAEWYRETYAETLHNYFDAATHYVIIGANDLLNPSPMFSTRFYFQKHPDIRKSGINPLMHYEKWGRSEGRVILPAYLDVTAMDPALAASQRSTAPSLWENADEARDYLSRLLTVKVSGEPVRIYQSFDCAQAKRFVSALEKLASETLQEMELVSIIMPTYNRAAQIRKAISSVLDQSWSNFELLVIDDGSTDETLQILDAYVDPRVRVLHSNRCGVSGARNEGLAHARGEMIFYLDSDNEWTPDFLWLMMHAMRQSGARCGYAGTRLQSPREFLIGYRGEPFDWEACLELNYVDMNVFCHYRDLAEEYGVFEVDLKRMVDWDLILRYTRNEKVFYAPFIGCIYHEDSFDMGRITTSQPIVSRKLVHDRNALGCSLRDAAANLSLNIAIKIFAPYPDREAWGDFHYAESLAEALQRQGHKVRIDFRNQWYDKPAHVDDVAIVLRGLEAYKPRATQLNIFWGISHPDTVTPEEYDHYQGIFVASASYAELLKVLLDRPVGTLWQCTDTTRFFPPNPDTSHNLEFERGVFIGNSRKEYRQIVRWAVEAGLPLDVIGQDWEEYIPSENILAQNASNRSLSSYYGTAAFVLNDHWQSMRDFGFVSNRIFDVLAAGGQLISDRLPSIESLFGNAVISVEGAEELRDVVANGAMNRSLEQRWELARIVHEQHSFDRRADTLTNWIRAQLVPSTFTEVTSGKFATEEILASRTRIGLLAPWSHPQRMNGTIEHLVAPLTTDRAATQFEIIPVETAEDCRTKELSALVIAGSDVLPDEFLLAAVKSRMKQGLPVYLECGNNSVVSGWGGLEDRYAEIWCRGDASRALWRADSARTVPARIDPRIWRRYRHPRPITPTKGPIRLLAIFENGLDSTQVRRLNAIITQLDRLEQAQANRISLELVGNVAGQVADRSWLRCRSWPEDCTTYIRKVSWLLDNAFADIGIVTENDGDQRMLQFMALGMVPIIMPDAACSITQVPGIRNLAKISETDTGFMLNLLSLIDNPNELVESRKLIFDRVWQDFSTLNAGDQKLSALLSVTESSK